MSSTPYRYYWAAWGALPVLAGLMLLSVAKGSVPLSLTQVLGALRLLDVPVSDMMARIVIDLRVPRTLLSVLTGAVLAMVGGLLQTTTRNDLADPFLFGLSSGASAGAVLVITRFGERLGRRAFSDLRAGYLLFIRRADQLSDFLRRPAGRQFSAVLVAGRPRPGAVG